MGHEFVMPRQSARLRKMLALTCLLLPAIIAAATAPHSLPKDSARLHSREKFEALVSAASPVSLARFNSTRQACPVSCEDAGYNPVDWTVYRDLDRLSWCDQSMLLDFTLFNPLDDPSTRTTIRSCSAGSGKSGLVQSGQDSSVRIAKTKRREDLSACSPNVHTIQKEAAVQVAYNGSLSVASMDDFRQASRQISQYLAQKDATCQQIISFATSGSTAVGLFAGSSIYAQGLVDVILDRFISSVGQTGYSDSAILQICADLPSTRYAMGIVTSADGDLPLVQKAVATWASGQCITSYDLMNELEIVTISIPAPVISDPLESSSTTGASSIRASTKHSSPIGSSVDSSPHGPSSIRKTSVDGISTTRATTQPTSESGSSMSAPRRTAGSTKRVSGKSTLSKHASSQGRSSQGAARTSSAGHSMNRRTDCTAIQVASGDTCSSLASECGITPAQFTQYNPASNECSTLTPGEHVCCSPGTLPDYSPQPYANGTCATYLVQSGDYCAEIASTYSITVSDLENWNQYTWGWMGCDDLQAAENICISDGYAAPFPAPIPNAVCGPQVPGTPIPPVGTNISTLNECPLRACCDIWGQCGTTDEFCTQSQSPTGAPGTAAQGTNGCISNCGSGIVTEATPDEYFKVGYFEGFNLGRSCLNQPITSMDFSAYTHIHLAFGVITPSFDIDVSGIQEQFNSFVSMPGNFKKILSIGGWAFSTDPTTYDIFREAVTSDNRDTLASNIASFVSTWQLDGIDLDWEYPGEPDIPGIPAGSASDGLNYMLFLQSLRQAMPTGTTISFTAPASFWYLKAFTYIDYMAAFSDYIIYMTYDLHGQWDYGNRWSDPGCPGGNCLRSDVNWTETLNALSMITRSGVSANQIVVGVTSYGRSFQMTSAGCTGPECTFTGPDSGAYAGLCTETAGYISNAEIAAIIAGNATLIATDGTTVGVSGSVSSYIDDSTSYSNIVVYDDTQWIAYMSDQNKANRALYYRAFGFLGTSDWAIDLQSFDNDVGNDQAAGIVEISPSIWGSGDPSITCEPPCIFVLPPFPLGFTSTIDWPVLTTTLLSSSANSIYTITTTIDVPAFTITDVDLQPVTLGPTETLTYTINPVQSVVPSSFIFTLGPDEATFPPTSIPTSSASVGGPVIGGGDPDPTTTTTSSAVLAYFPGATFYSTPVPITIQPQPTYSITLPQPLPHVTISVGPPGPPCINGGCGSRDCGLFGCSGGGGCGLFACGGGCGIFGCGGGCGPFGCGGGCPLDKCGGLNCVTPGSCGGDEGGGDEEEECESPVTVSDCTYFVSTYMTPPMTTYSTTTKTDCSTITTCDGANSVTTETAASCQASIQQAYATALASAGEYVSGTWVPSGFLGPDLGTTTSLDYFFIGMSVSSTTSQCNACTYVDGTEALCNLVPGCTETTVITETIYVTPEPAPTTIAVPPEASAQCASWIVLDTFYTFQVYDIVGWSNDGGDSLHHQEDGCGALTGWEWYPATSEDEAAAQFNLPFFIKSGCVERAVVSAGGPKLQCQFQGYVDDILGLLKRDGSTSLNSTSSQSPSSTPADPHTLPSTASSASNLTAMSTTTTMPWPTIHTSNVTFPYTYNTSFTSVPMYTPMTWDSGMTVTLTVAPISSFTTTYSTTSIIANGTTAQTVPLPGSGVTSSSATATSFSGTSTVTSAGAR